MNAARLRVATVVVVIAALVGAASLLPVREYLQQTLEWTRGLGVWGPVALGGAYIVACVVMFPGLLLSIGAGFLFGMVVGTICVSLGSTLGACAAFLIGRTVGRSAVEQMIAGLTRFAAIDRAVGRAGFQVVLLARLSPVLPFNVLNYVFGLTRVRFRDYALASWVGMLPGTLMYVAIGSTLANLSEVESDSAGGGWVRTGLLVLGLVATVALVVVTTRLARGTARNGGNCGRRRHLGGRPGLNRLRIARAPDDTIVRSIVQRRKKLWSCYNAGMSRRTFEYAVSFAVLVALAMFCILCVHD